MSYATTSLESVVDQIRPIYVACGCETGGDKMEEWVLYRIHRDKQPKINGSYPTDAW